MITPHISKLTLRSVCDKMERYSERTNGQDNHANL